MVHFVSPSDGPDICIVAAGEPFEPLVNDDIMHNKLGKSLRHDTKTHRVTPPHSGCLHTIHDAEETGDSKNDKEGIIFFKEPWLYLMMVLMEVPKEPMHHPPVCAPGYPFHQ